jgi:hypothetical protein
MSALVDIFQLNPAASAFGTAGLVCQLAWPLFRRHRTIMSVQFGVGANYGLHYALMDAWSGAGLAGLGAMQSAIAFLAGDRPWLRWVSFAFLPVAVAVCYATWCGLPSMLALTALTLIMIGRMQRDPLQVRILLLTATPFGMGYDILVGAAPALVGGIVSGAVAVVMLAREIRERRWAPSSKPRQPEI